MVIQIKEADQTIVEVKGEVDISNVDHLGAALEKASTKSPKGFVVDASGISYVDAVGLRTILLAWKRLTTQGGVLALVAGDLIKKLLEILDATNLPGLVICDSIHVAMEAVSSSTCNEVCSQDQWQT
ncbi:MAG: STAS domain-containing protein [Armatimonadota bacterium]